MARSDGRVVSEFIIRALEGKPLEIYGDGNQTRSFCYVDDLVSGLIKTADLDESYSAPINLGNPTENTINEIATMILEKTKSSSEIVFHPGRVDEPRKRKPNIDRATRLLAWEPKVDLNTGLNKTIQFFMATGQLGDEKIA
jgi:UDP-glucuronate decarboxylase